MKIEFLGVAQIIHDPEGWRSSPAKGRMPAPHRMVAVLNITGGGKSIPAGIKPYDKSALPYMRMLIGVNGVLQSENPSANMQALDDALEALAETEKNIAAGRQAARFLPFYPRDFAEPAHIPPAPQDPWRSDTDKPPIFH